MQAELSEYMRERLRQADQTARDLVDLQSQYAAQQQIIWLLLERLGGSVTIGLESMVTRRRGSFQVYQDPDTGATTISLQGEGASAA